MPDLLDRLKTALADRYAIEREIGSGGMATLPSRGFETPPQGGSESVAAGARYHFGVELSLREISIGAIVAVLAIGTGGCSDSPARILAPVALSVEIVDNIGPLLAALEVKLNVPASIDVDYWTESIPRLRVTSPQAQFHRVLLARLAPARVYQFEIRLTAPAELRGVTHRGEFATDTLPYRLARIVFDATGQTTLPLTMLEIIGGDDLFTGYAAINAQGTVMWYWPTDGLPHGWSRRTNGNFVLMALDVGVMEVTPEGHVIAEVPSTPERTMHHDVVVTPANTVLFIANDRRAVDGILWAGEGIWEWDPDQNVLEQRWSSFDFLSPATDRGPRSNPNDWLHLNSLSIGPRGNLIVSSPYLSQIISISSDYRSLEWRLGGPGTTLNVTPHAVFSGQHSATELSPGRILLFDKGASRGDGALFSRALELQVDFNDGSVTNAWEFRPSPDNYTPFVSSTRRLANGNTMVAFGLSRELPLGSSGIEVYEVTTAQDVIWHLRIGGPTVLYRASPLSNIAGEMTVGGQ